MTRVRQKPRASTPAAAATPPVSQPATHDTAPADRLAAPKASSAGARAPQTAPAAPKHLHIKLRERPTGKLKALLEELQASSLNDIPLEKFLPTLVERKQTADALRLLQYISRSDPANSLEFDVWEAALLAAQNRYDDAHTAMVDGGGATWGKYLEASQFLAGRQEKATLWLAEQAVRLEPHADKALLHLAQVYGATGDCDAALNTLARLAELQPLEPEALALRAGCRMRLGQYEAARPDLEVLAAACPEASEFVAMLAAVDVEAGEHQAARARCAGLGNRRLQTLGGVRALIHAACRLDDAELLHTCLQHAIAAQYCEADGFAELLHTQARLGNMNGALSVARLATRTLPEDANLQCMLGQLLDATGRPGEAAAAYAEALRFAENDSTLAVLHAEALLAAGDHKLAAAAFRDLYNRTPIMPALRGMLACLKARNAAPRDTVAWLQRAYARQPDDIGVAHDFIHAAFDPANKAYRRRGVAALEILHAQDPDAPQWRALLARAVRDKDPERALALAEGALDVAPNHDLAQAVRDASLADLQAQKIAHAHALKAIKLPGAATPAEPLASVTFRASTREITGIEVGRNYENRTAVRTADGTLVWAPWSVCGGARPVGAVAALKAGAAFAVPEGLAKRFDTLLTTAVVHAATVADFCRVIGKRGEAFLSGGAVRDIIADPHHTSPRDIDLVVTLAPSLVRLTCGALTGDTPGLKDRPNGVVSPYPLEYFGLVKYGTVQNGVVRATLDVMSMRSFGALEPMQHVEGAHRPVKPVAFGPDLHADALFRDFTCNALYYDPTTRTLLDPTGIGKVDAELRRLQLCSLEHIRKNESLGWRYIKMRQLGYTATLRTREAISQHFAHFSTRPDAAVWLRRSLLRVFPELEDTAVAQTWYEEATRLLEVDAVGEAALHTAIRHAIGVAR